MTIHGRTPEPKIDKSAPKSKPKIGPVSSKKAGPASTKEIYFPYRTTIYNDCDSIECCDQVPNTTYS